MAKYIVAADFTVHPLINKTPEMIIQEILEGGLARLDFKKTITLTDEEIVVEEEAV
jgi:hypothetical protein